MPDPNFPAPSESESPGTRFAVSSPAGIYTLAWTAASHFRLIRQWDAGPRTEAEGNAGDGTVPAQILAADVTDQGCFALAALLGTGESDSQTAFFVAGPDGYRRMGGLWKSGVAALGLAPSGSWLAIQALPAPPSRSPFGPQTPAGPEAPEAGLLHLFNTAEGKLLWAVPSETGFGTVRYRFDEVAGLVYVQTAGGEFPYHLPDGRFESQRAYRHHVVEQGTPSQLRDLAHREFQLLGPDSDLSPARRRAAAKSIFQLLTLAAQRGPDWAPAFAALGDFFDWLPDPTKASRCHARAQELRGESGSSIQ